MARPLVGQQLVALPAAALEAAHGVAAEVVAASVVDQALVDVCGAKREGPGKWARATRWATTAQTSLPCLACCPLPRADLRSLKRSTRGGGLTAVGVRRMGSITSPWDLASLAFMAQKTEEVMSAAS